MPELDLDFYMAELEGHVEEHGLHAHDRRHVIERLTLDQTWELELHPEDSCDGPMDIGLRVLAQPRPLLAFIDLPEDPRPEDDVRLPLELSWHLPPLETAPDSLNVALDLAGIGGTVLPIELNTVTTVDATGISRLSLRITGSTSLSLIEVSQQSFEEICPLLDRCVDASRYLLDSLHLAGHE